MVFNMGSGHHDHVKHNSYLSFKTYASHIMKYTNRHHYHGFAKAFNKVPQMHLLHKFKYCGVPCNALNWISDFLTDRTQTVVLECVMSEKVSVVSGVPYGTVIFIIYLNDFSKYIKYSTLRQLTVLQRNSQYK